ncbi:unnamed protein product [Cuscuta campestris]|uniref:Uncharacterized protein n=1 Tax=Cuscuta campestris TaxID=132261 RepID=A0A484KGR9_9ASTE|nr:unnamed protein product [Cuscuta campestris]
MQLEQRFYNIVKGASTIATYCQTLRNIADWLDDVDAPVTKNQLVLQTLRGLPEDLGSQASFLQFQKPCRPSWKLDLHSSSLKDNAAHNQLLATRELPWPPSATVASGSRVAVVCLQAAGSKAAVAVAVDSSMADSIMADNLKATADVVDDRTAVAVEVVTLDSTPGLLQRTLDPGKPLTKTPAQAYWAHAPPPIPSLPRPTSPPPPTPISPPLYPTPTHSPPYTQIHKTQLNPTPTPTGPPRPNPNPSPPQP